MVLNLGRLRWILVLMVALILASTGITYWAGRNVIECNQQIIAEQTALSEVQQAFSILKDAETGQRGYLLTGEESYRGPYDEAVTAIHQSLQRLQTQAEAGILNPADVTELSRLVDQKLAEMKQTVELRRDQGMAAAMNVMRSDVGKHTMDAIRDRVTRMGADLRNHLAELSERSNWLTLLRSTLFVATAGAELVFCLWAYWRIRDEMADHAAATAEVRRQKDLLAVTLASIGDAVMVTDNQLRITFMNAVAESLTGWSSAEAKGRSVGEVFRIINEKTRLPVSNPIERVLASGMVVGLANHTLLVRRDGTEIPIDDSGAPIRDETGHIHGVVLIFRDFSEHKAAEHRLLEANATAESANRAKDQFLATLSHELRMPLTPVLATLSMWEASEEVPAELKSDIQMLRRNVDLEARLIDDLLDLSRIARGKFSLNRQTVDFHDLLTSVVGIVRPEVATRHHRLVFHLRAARHLVSGDSARLQQIMWNLLKNAVKFTENGGRITVETDNTQDGRIELRISDTGIGMTSDTLRHIFRPFEQGSSETARQYGGLGLGLAIAKALADAQGGVITAQSEGAGKGSTFTVSFPTAEGFLPNELPPVTPPAHAPSRSLRMLLLEDHDDSAQALGRILESLGHHVTIAPTVGDALRQVETQTFDLILSDLGLPDGTGLDFIRQVRTRHRMAAVALTGFGMEDDVSRCREAGFDAHLTKPVNYQKLEETIRRLAGQTDGNGQGDSAAS